MAMSFHIRLRILVAVIAIAATVAGLAAWDRGLFHGSRLSSNSIIVITPYRYSGTWVFDDERTGLVREPFVGGVPEMIDVLVTDIPEAENGFRLYFSASPFPDYQKKLTWMRGTSQGNYYRLDETEMEGWLCPALFKYYRTAPRELYIKAEPRQ